MKKHKPVMARKPSQSRVEALSRWALLWWYPKEAMDMNKPEKTLYSEHLIFEDCKPSFFTSRTEARNHAIKHYGYILEREDLRRCPHYWRLPKPVRVTGVVITEVLPKKRKRLS